MAEPVHGQGQLGAPLALGVVTARPLATLREERSVSFADIPPGDRAKPEAAGRLGIQRHGVPVFTR